VLEKSLFPLTGYLQAVYDCYSDTIGNKGALINITPDLELSYKTFEAVVSIIMTVLIRTTASIFVFNYYIDNMLNILFQPHPNVKPMAYASQFGGLFM
jgi:serine/threonine-protein phosphatase 5